MADLARIGDYVITTDDIDRVLDSFPEKEREFLDCPDGRERILNQKIANRLMALAAKEEGKTLNSGMETKKADFEEQYLSQTELNEALAALAVSDEEAKQYYEDCKDSFRTDEQVNARHILVDSQEKAETIRKEILSGEISFEDAAKQYSSCSSAPSGGELGFFPHGTMVPEFDEAAFRAEMNEVTEPVKTQFGYHLIKVIDRKDPGVVPFEEVQAQILEQMRQARREQIIISTIEDLKAKYGDSEVTEEDIDRLIAQYPEQHQQYLQTEEGRDGVREQKKAYIVLTRAARDKGRDQEESFLRAMSDFEEQLLAQQAIQDIFDTIEISDADARQYYNITISQYRINDQVSARHILVDSREKAEEIRKDILAGTISFEDAAKEYSSCPSKEEGGDLGYFEHGQMVSEFDEAAFAAAVGEITEPVQTKFGYHLIKVEDKKEAGEKPFEEVKDQIVQQMMDQRKNEAYCQKLEDLKKQYRVKWIG